MIDYIMNKKVEKALAKLKDLPEREQEVAAEAILDYAVGAGEPRITDEQLAEVERRLADPKPTFVSLAELRARFKRIGA